MIVWLLKKDTSFIKTSYKRSIKLAESSFENDDIYEVFSPTDIRVSVQDEWMLLVYYLLLWFKCVPPKAHVLKI